MRLLNIAIVGGGPGGLMTAYLLQQQLTAPMHVTLFEASERLGGKLQTKSFVKASAHYEAGAAELYDYSMIDEDPLKELVGELGLFAIPMGGSSVILDNRVLTNLDDIQEHFGTEVLEALTDFDRQAKASMSPREFYAIGHTDPSFSTISAGRFDTALQNIREPTAQRYIENLIHSDLATEPKHTSISYGLQNYLMNDPTYTKLYSIAGGNQRLSHELASRIDATVLLQHTVTAIGSSGREKIQVTSSAHGHTRVDDFDFVVIALPMNHLTALHFHPPRLAHAMRQHHARYNHPAHYLRVTILFDRPFWRSVLTDHFLMLDRFGGCCLYDESAREPESTAAVLGWLISGQAALEMSKLDNDALIEQALGSLPDSLSCGRHSFIEGNVHRWVDAVNALPGGMPPLGLDERHQPEPVEHPNLFIVGDYLFDSTLNGVLDSATHVAGWMAALGANDSFDKSPETVAR